MMKDTMKNKNTLESSANDVGNGWSWKAIMETDWEGLLPDGNYRFWTSNRAYRQFTIFDRKVVVLGN